MPLLLAGRTFAELVDKTVFQTGHRHDTIHTKIMNKKCNMIKVSGAKERTQILCTGLFSRSQNAGTCCYHILCLDQTLFLFRTDVIMPGKQFVWYLETPLRINGPSVDVLRWREVVFFLFLWPLWVGIHWPVVAGVGNNTRVEGLN